MSQHNRERRVLRIVRRSRALTPAEIVRTRKHGKRRLAKLRSHPEFEILLPEEVVRGR